MSDYYSNIVKKQGNWSQPWHGHPHIQLQEALLVQNNDSGTKGKNILLIFAIFYDLWP